MRQSRFPFYKSQEMLQNLNLIMTYPKFYFTTLHSQRAINDRLFSSYKPSFGINKYDSDVRRMLENEN